ncbi:MAG: DNA polymerase III subunit beta [Candidatus Abawacabacteria bacterium RBG_16_42_10]|uniref:Beta sliding clamp n=1 Tax=Candidatus Abawacabacteria bacterium RBG_16_42_10 TaxID=1817814 RepID=A0A1F4XLA2_9BACT|nr:MAG: DNA polymerase III subunit beta [Candidatus Abawacabacteria bacterium RBG_16_42_10]
MKFVCSQENLTQALDIVTRAIPTRSTLPVLGNVLIKAEEKKVILSTTNLELAIVTSFDCNPEEIGSITIPAKLFSSYCNLLKVEQVTVEQLPLNTLQVKSGQDETVFKGIDAQEFPLIPQVEEKIEFTLPFESILDGLEKTVFASASDETRPVLAGVLFWQKDGILKLVATDSYRLAEKTIKLATKIPEEIKIIVPSRTVLELQRILSKKQEEVKVIVGQNQVKFIIDNVTVISRLIEGNFPPYEKIIPESFSSDITIEREEFIRAVKRVSLFSQAGTHNLHLEMDGGDLTVSGETQEVGKDTSILKGKMNGEGKKITFSAQFLLAALEHIPEENITLNVNSDTSPGLLKGKEEGYINIIMPRKV